MSEWLDSQKTPASNFRQLLQERIEKANPRRKLTSEEEKRLARLEAIEIQTLLQQYIQHIVRDILLLHPLRLFVLKCLKSFAYLCFSSSLYDCASHIRHLISIV